MRRDKGVSMITLIITIIVIIILAAIAFVASGDTVNSAQFSTFSQEFGDYAVNFETGPVAKLEEKLGLQGKTATKAQKIYASARNVDVSTLTGVITPAGVSFRGNDIAILKNAAGVEVTEEYWGTVVGTDEPSATSIACYQIKDSQIGGYKNGHEFYGDNLGAETHWVTEKGFVFTLPGYPRQVDGEYRMYISPEVYYVATKDFASVINGTECVAVAAHVAEGGIANNASDATDSVVAGEGGETEEPGEEGETTNNLADIKVGDYVSYTPNTAASGVKWRVWEVNGSSVVIMPTSPVGRLYLGYENESDDTATKRADALNDYNTAVAQIEALCDNYASSSLGVTESDVRSLTIEDLEDANVSTLGTTKLSYTGGLGYGNKKTYTSGNYYGARYDGSKNVISSTFIAASTDSPVELKQTFYYSNAPGWKTLPGSSDTYGTLLGGSYSWLASPCVDCDSSGAYFIVHTAFSGGVNARLLFHSGGYAYSSSYRVRPLVSLSSTLLGVDAENPGDGSSSAPWNLVKVQ